MNVTENPVKKATYVASPETVKIIEMARKAAIGKDKIFVAASFQQVIEVFNVCVRIPSATAKYLKFVPPHEIAVLNEEKTGLNFLSIPDHFVHGDFMRRDDDGKVKPSVIRHFMVNEADLGKELPCTVVIKEKKDLLTGEVTVIIDVIAQIGQSQCDKALRLGVPSLGINGEVSIPETDMCIRFETIEIKTMERKKIEKPVAPITPASVMSEAPAAEAKKITKPVIEEKPKLQLKKWLKFLLKNPKKWKKFRFSNQNLNCLSANKALSKKTNKDAWTVQSRTVLFYYLKYF